MNFHDDILAPEQNELLVALGPIAAGAGFFLGGGTAVALHLGHRRSIDFDWFTAEKLEDPLALAASLRSADIPLEDTRVASGTLHGMVRGVRISFFAYHYPCLSTPVTWAELGFTLASLDDLACMKLAAVAQRGSRKDFADIYAICLKYKPLQELLQLYRRKYGTNDISHVLVSLGYFDDADEEAALAMIWDVSWEEMKRKIVMWVKGMA